MVLDGKSISTSGRRIASKSSTLCALMGIILQMGVRIASYMTPSENDCARPI